MATDGLVLEAGDNMVLFDLPAGVVLELPGRDIHPVEERVNVLDEDTGFMMDYKESGRSVYAVHVIIGCMIFVL